MKGVVIYNRNERVWEVWRNGKVLHTYPAGKDGHFAALEHQIALNDVPTLRLVQRATKRYPELRSRLIRAASLMLDGRIEPDDGRYLVRSQTGNGYTYEVSFTMEGAFQCTCPDFEFGLSTNASGAPWQGSGPKCKHILAVTMLLYRSHLHYQVRRLVEDPFKEAV